MPSYSFLQQTENHIRKTFDVNVLAHFWMLEAFLPHMISKKKGHIVATSSIAGLIGLTNLVPYCASKFAVRGLMEALHEEIREDSRNLDIHTTTVYPYMVDTGLCKKPKIRFPSILGLIDPKTAAEAIILAHRQGLTETCIPRYLFHLNSFTRWVEFLREIAFFNHEKISFRLFPYQCGLLIKDFVDSGVEEEN